MRVGALEEKIDHTESPENKAMIKNAKKKKGVRSFN